MKTRELSDEVARAYPELQERKRRFDEAGLVQVSASRLKLYRECRYRFWRQYILGETEPPHHSAQFGKALHASIDLFYSRGAEPKITFVQLLDEFDPYRQYDWYYRDGLRILNTMDFTQYRPAATERPFVELLTERTYVFGFIDLIDERGWVVDFKSSKYKPASINADPQFALYAFAYTRMFGKPPERVFWHHLRTGELVEGDVEYLLAVTLPAVKATAAALVNDRFEDVEKCYACKYYCPYKNT